MKKTRDLQVYKQKRQLGISGEPDALLHKSSKKPIFVVQEHHASRLHYDFRIEHNGVLLSWAIPKGPSTNPEDKRLAVSTEDHPLDYAHFQGIIPEGHYGAGIVRIWDHGTYTNLKQASMASCLKKGSIAIFLHGKKLKGAFALIKTTWQEKENWLFFKMKDDYAQEENTLKIATKKRKPKLSH